MDLFPAHAQAGTPDASELAFSERAFFLKAFQGIFLTFVLSENSDLSSLSLTVFQQVLQELITKPWACNGETGKVLIVYQESPQMLARLEPLFLSLAPHLFRSSVVDPHSVPAVLWQPAKRLGRPPLVALGIAAETQQLFEEKTVALGLRLRMSRLIWTDQEGGIRDGNEQVMGFINSARLADIVRENSAKRSRLLTQFQALLAGGIKAISLCRLAELDQELFTYQGMGSFFSRHPYCRVRRLGLDDFEHTAAIMRKGEQEGFLLARPEEAISDVLANSYGAFILEDRLAGICALKTAPYQQEQAGEIVSLYTLTRFQRVGVGGQLLSHVVHDAKRLGLKTLFACTRHDRVADFFLRGRFGRHRQQFSRVDASLVPENKW
ncbi:MAG: GNAT family N-acetyltransferase, partial [Magnetococcales bacterium]|nr:GNAT family N-acetyltransferase [Magnetococcales bacterium]